MSNEFYTVSGTPSTGSSGSSAAIRAEYTLVAAGFDKLPVPSTTANKVWATNSGGTAAEGRTVSGTGNIVAASGAALDGLTSLGVKSAAAFDMEIANSETLTANRTLTVVTGDANRTLTLAGNATISGTNTGDQTNITGNAATATLAATVTTNANLTGPITSVGNATSVASQTGTGTTFVMSTGATLTNPTFSGAVTMSGTNTITGTTTLQDSTTTIVDNGDATKKLAFQVSGITTGTTRTATWPDKDGTVAMTSDVTSSGLPTLYYAGLQCAWASTTTMTVGAGKARDSGDANDLTISSTITGTLQSSGAWAAGTGQNKLDTGARANSTVYHSHLIRKTADGTADWLFSTSATSGGVTLPSGYAYGRRLKAGQVKTDGSSNIIKTLPRGNFRQEWDVQTQDFNTGSNSAVAAVTRTLNVPTGIRVTARTNFFIRSGTTATYHAIFTSLDQTDTAPSSSNYDTRSVSGSGAISSSVFKQLMTNTSGQVRSRGDASGANDECSGTTCGWVDDVEVD